MATYIKSTPLPAGIPCVILALLFSSFIPAPANAAPRKFTNSAGKIIEADLVSATASTVTLKMSNGRQITAKNSLFSEEDQKYIADWLKKHPVQLSYKFDIDQSRTKKGKSKTRSGVTNILNEEWAFKINVKNLSKEGKNNADIKNLKVSYKIYKSANANAARRSSGGNSTSVAGKYIVTNGSKTIASLPYLQSTDMETSPVTISTSQLHPDYVYTSGSKSKKRDKLEGIWIKLFHEGKQVGEFKSSGGALKSAIWK